MKEIIAQAVESELARLAEEWGTDRGPLPSVVIQHPARPEFGEYSTNAALLGAKMLRRPPMIIAEELAGRLAESEFLRGMVTRVEAAAPGFVNFHLDWEHWVRSWRRKTPPAGNGPKVLIEHTSINPNKSAHIGHLRNSCIGDTLARLLKHTGAKVEVHNYIDDLGNQLADTLVGLRLVKLAAEHRRFGDFCWDIYAGINQAYKADPGLQAERTQVLHELEQGHSGTAWTGLLVAERIVREHVEEMAGFGIGYDILVWESSIVREGFWEAAFRLLQRTPSFVRETEGKLAGCWVLKQQPDGRTAAAEPDADYQQDKVLVRSNGILTYTAKDIAYHLWKFGLLDKDFTYRKFSDGLWSTQAGGVKKPVGHADMVINVIDQRQEYPQAMVKEALSALGYLEEAAHLKHVGYGVVSLSPATAAGLGIDISDGRTSYPMSGRQGIGVKIADLLDRMEEAVDAKRTRKAGIGSRAIAAASIRYYLLKYHLQTEVVFDLEQATEVTGNTGVYLLYTYARACSVLRKAELQQVGLPDASKLRMCLGEPERQLLRKLAYGAETLEQAAAELSPQVLCGYAFELASLYNRFYAACPVLKAEEEVRDIRLWLTARVQETLREFLGILGMPAPSRM
ncbi:arginine--tRNA ligase [Gorillibacterium sp. sgz5001074]|uniref:arginine--tRNA ligase n=1 Tax=Gorillibacterium sp. sgz5001074 TaxID=3446695 RepID=UPI003F67AFB5